LGEKFKEIKVPGKNFISDSFKNVLISNPKNEFTNVGYRKKFNDLSIIKRLSFNNSDVKTIELLRNENKLIHKNNLINSQMIGKSPIRNRLSLSNYSDSSVNNSAQKNYYNTIDLNTGKFYTNADFVENSSIFLRKSPCFKHNLEAKKDNFNNDPCETLTNLLFKNKNPLQNKQNLLNFDKITTNSPVFFHKSHKYKELSEFKTPGKEENLINLDQTSFSKCIFLVSKISIKRYAE